MPTPANLVHERSTTTGTGSFTLAAVNGRQRFSTAFGIGVTTNVFDYFISNSDAAEWERGTGHMSGANTLVRDTVLESTNANAAVNFSAGVKHVTNDIPAAFHTHTGAGAIARSLISRLGEVVSVKDFGAVGDGVTDDAAAIQAAINYVAALATATEGPAGKVFAPAGHVFKIGTGLTVSVPIEMEFLSYLNYTPTTGAALTIGAAAPSPALRHTGYNIYLVGIRAVNGNTVLPTGVNLSGCHGLVARTMQFSTVHVGKIIGFTGAGFYADCSGLTYSGQHVQDNTINLGEIAYNGVGIYNNSLSAVTDACQVNFFNVQNCFSNWLNISDDASNHAGSSNTYNFAAMDAPAPGGTAGSIYSSFNKFYFGFLDGTIVFQASSASNTMFAVNTNATGAAFTDAGTNNRLWTGGADNKSQIADWIGSSFKSLTVSRPDAGLALDFSGGTEPGSFTSGHGQIGGGSMDLSGNMWLSGGLAVGTHTTPSAGSILGITGVGYSTGAGGAVTQGTSRTTTVVVNNPCGAITLFSAAGSTTPASFTVTNNKVAATDTIVLSQKSGTDKYVLLVTAVAAGSFQITFYTTGGTTTEQPVISFSVVKAVAA